MEYSILKIQSKIFKIIEDPTPDFGHLSALEWLQKYQQPICIYLNGEDTSQTRAVSTLLHGNEPSGFSAIIHWLNKGQKPAVNIVCFISAIEAALREPPFTHRTTESNIDLNRVFQQPFDSMEGEIANDMLNILDQVRPQCLVDIHNTSGLSPAYAVVTEPSQTSKQIACLFVNECIVFNIQLGTLVETVADDYPSIVIECGGAGDPDSYLRAEQGIEQYFMVPDLSLLSTHNLVVRKDPIRVELKQNCTLCYGESLGANCDIVLPLDADKFNSEILRQNQALAWVKSHRLDDILDFVNLPSDLDIKQYFYIDDNRLFARQDLRLYMVTTNVEIAKSDCLFYLIPCR